MLQGPSIVFQCRDQGLTNRVALATNNNLMIPRQFKADQLRLAVSAHSEQPINPVAALASDGLAQDSGRRRRCRAVGPFGKGILVNGPFSLGEKAGVGSY